MFLSSSRTANMLMNLPRVSRYASETKSLRFSSCERRFTSLQKLSTALRCNGKNKSSITRKNKIEIERNIKAKNAGKKLSTRYQVKDNCVSDLDSS
jgi:hypothetical protein